MKTESMIGMSLPIVAVGMLAGCCATSPVGEYVEPVNGCPAPVSVREYREPAWVRPCNYPVTRRYYPTLAGEAPRQFLTAGTQYDLGVRTRPYFTPWGIAPVGERIYYRRPFSPFGFGGRYYDATTQNWERCAPFGPNSPTSPSQWW